MFNIVVTRIRIFGLSIKIHFQQNRLPYQVGIGLDVEGSCYSL
jgi:hypothetical protein